MVFVLIVSGVISAVLIAFVVRSVEVISESNEPAVSQRSEVFTNLCKSLLLSDLRNEMKAGSFDPKNPDSASLPKVATEKGSKFILYPKTPHSAVPTRMRLKSADGNWSEDPNILKWSSRDSAFFSEPEAGSHSLSSYFPAASPAAPVSTTEPSLNQKAVSPALWEMPRLFAGGSAASSRTVPTPDWVLVGSLGSRPRGLPVGKSDSIIGRYAFVIYDEGGLLDLNVAGFPSVSASGDRRLRYEQGLKGGIGFADLSVLFVRAGFPVERSQALSNSLLQWRHDGFKLGTSSGIYGLKYKDYLLGEKLGFLFGVPEGGRGFASRRSMIEVVERLAPLDTDASRRNSFLQMAGTFSREITQPSLRPDFRRPHIRSPEKGGNDLANWDPAFTSPVQNVNPPFLQVGRGGQPLVQRRFPLSRLSLLSAGAVSAQGGSIHRFFGLTRGAPSEPWVYAESGLNGILTLSEVAMLVGTNSREPNFVELLKAAIAVGALAPSLGPAQLGGASDSSVDEAIIQIAANIIDQFDADGFPTRIRLPSRDGSRSREVSGIESLPYIYEVRTVLTPLKPSNPPSPFVGGDPDVPPSLFSQRPIVDPGSAWMWQQVSVWNPHAQAVPGAAALAVPAVSAGPLTPERFRVVVGCDFPISLWAARQHPMPYAGFTVPPSADEPEVSEVKIGGEQLRFKLEGDALNAFSQPVFLLSSNPAPGVEVERGRDNLAPLTGVPDELGNGHAGVAVAVVPRISDVSASHDGVTEKIAALPEFYVAHPDNKPATDVFLNYSLEYLQSERDGVETWVAYDRKSSVLLGAAVWVLNANAFLDASWSVACPNGLSRFLAPDPRSARFGPFLNGVSGVQMEDKRFGAVDQRFYRNTLEREDWYADPDGVIRRASGFLSGTVPHEEGAFPRPLVLNRPFRSVAELGYAFSGVPWRQLDFVTPESGFSGLLDVFCISENQHPQALERGRVSLNTRHPAVLEAVLSGAYVDELDPLGPSLAAGDSGHTVSTNRIARALVERTSSLEPGKGPIGNLSELVGRWVGAPSAGGVISGANAYSGFSADLDAVFSSAPTLRSSERARHSVVRALADSGSTRVWNLMIDLVVQVGRYPPRGAAARPPRNAFEAQREKERAQRAAKSSPLAAFQVEGERHLWWHVAIDRLTGEVLDEAVELIDN